MRAGSSATTRSAHVAEISRHPVLSREEEHELAVRYRETGDVDAAYRLVASNLRLVVKSPRVPSHRVSAPGPRPGSPMGLMQAVKKYDPWRA